MLGGWFFFYFVFFFLFCFLGGGEGEVHYKPAAIYTNIHSMVQNYTMYRSE